MLLNFDLAGAEWWVTAFLSRDPAMLDLARQSPRPSPHPITGARMTGLTPEIVTREDKIIGKANDPLVITALRKEKIPEVLSSLILPRTMSIRQAAKKANHGLNYREGYKTFALKNEMDELESRRIVSLYREKSYPGLLKWYDWIDAKIRADRTMTNCFGDKIYFMGQLNDETFRAATAAVPQSTVVRVTSRAMTMFMNDDREMFDPAHLLAQVHDSLLFEYLDLDWLRMARFVIEMVEHLSPSLDYSYMAEFLSPEIEYRAPFKLEVEAKGGFDWGHLHQFELSNDNEVLAHNLRKCWEESLKERNERLAA